MDLILNSPPPGLYAQADKEKALEIGALDEEGGWSRFKQMDFPQQTYPFFPLFRFLSTMQEIVEEEVEKGTFPAIPAILEKWNILSFSIISRSNEGRRWTIGEIKFDQEQHHLFSHLYEACRAQMNVSDKRDPLLLFSFSWETTPKIRIHTGSSSLYRLFGKVKRAVANVERGYGIAMPEDKQLAQQLGGCVRTS
uniref:Uncharacterized protein n=1 Tax=Chromera velia CCMP2878 TaxID=1169474 RepID=A0A0G4I8Z4_9ALVE|eukprot:Cvel_12070.t1-p1 / transcript=Cvel_12070.t1 / gene=Cvel_12070 / organism=Chromera_velia_CCMP2878 / gene_product=hypothetical protein / transcript_product=hypothetical protein / location=Cvel_scaffold776:13344-13925(-) / protein_length=194 / sequence_SO=supercontig / SO=protein_coding / is_pseudo=false